MIWSHGIRQNQTQVQPWLLYAGSVAQEATSITLPIHSFGFCKGKPENWGIGYRGMVWLWFVFFNSQQNPAFPTVDICVILYSLMSFRLGQGILKLSEGLPTYN